MIPDSFLLWTCRKVDTIYAGMTLSPGMTKERNRSIGVLRGVANFSSLAATFPIATPGLESAGPA